MSVRVVGFAFCALLLAACAGRTNGFTPFSPAGGASSRHVEPARDLGRRAAGKPVSVVLLLKYRDQAGLDRFVGQLERSRSAHYLTRQEFIARYAPTPQQERAVIDALHRAGFTVEKRYGNRTILDATAPARVAERFFKTEIHDYKQGRAVRFASVKPAIVPSRLSSLVATAMIDTVARMHVGYNADAAAAPPDSLPVSGETSSEPATSTGNVIKNPGFESRTLKPWQGCGSPGVANGKLSNIAHSGRHGASTGTTSAPEVAGVSCVWQLVTIPAQGVLTAYVLRSTNDTNKSKVQQFAALYTAGGKYVATLFSSLVSSKHWAKVTMRVGKYAGQQLYVAFGVFGVKKDASKYVAMSIDDVSLTGTVVTPSPSPSPTTNPSSPPVGPDTPCPGAPTPTPNSGPNGGWGPTSVGDGMLMGSIYCYNGAGQTAAIVIDAFPSASDVSTYLQYFGITRGGSILDDKVNGGDASPSADSLGEATLDLETIASLAPNANVLVYEIPELSDTDVVDAYNQILVDGQASVVNSSFSGCEANDPSYNTTTNMIAQQGAAEGVTFSASSGDQGQDCYDNGNFVPGAGAPASDPYFVGVGGTQSTSLAVSGYCQSVTPITNPVVWNDCVGQGGAGVSTQWPLPSFQVGVASAAKRSVPDVSLPAAGIDIYIANQSGWGTFWGTSWASPMYVAMQLEINEECAKNYWGNAALYGSFAADPTYQHAFVDVTSGNNNYIPRDGGAPPPAGTDFTAVPGFDTASGIGIPLGVNVAYYTCGAGAIAARADRGRR
jgi:Pro-kumamolisin, activation domain